MNKAGGFIALHRKILEWQWADDPNTFTTFVHLLLMAYFEDCDYRGRTIKRGQVVTSLSSLGKKTGQTIQQTRTSLKHLISTGEITSETSNQNQVITIVNYDMYQTSNTRGNKRSTNDQQANQQANQQQYNNINNINKEINKQSIVRGFTPPTLTELQDYIQEKGFTIDAEYFFNHYEACGWVLKGGQKMKNWRAALATWQKREERYGRSGQKQAGISASKDSGDDRPDFSYLRNTVINL